MTKKEEEERNLSPPTSMSGGLINVELYSELVFCHTRHCLLHKKSELTMVKQCQLNNPEDSQPYKFPFMCQEEERNLSPPTSMSGGLINVELYSELVFCHHLSSNLHKNLVGQCKF